MEQKKKMKKRWRYFIDKPFQIRFILKFSGLILFGLALSIGIIGINYITKFNAPLYFKAKDVSELKVSDLHPDNIGAIIDLQNPLNVFQVYLPALIYISVLYIILIFIFGLFISHNLAGPVYRIKKTLDEAADKKIDIRTLEFKLRKKDELQDLVDSLNRFLESIKDDIKR